MINKKWFYIPSVMYTYCVYLGMFLDKKKTFFSIIITCRGVETASHAGHCPINLVNVW